MPWVLLLKLFKSEPKASNGHLVLIYHPFSLLKVEGLSFLYWKCFCKHREHYLNSTDFQPEMCEAPTPQRQCKEDQDSLSIRGKWHRESKEGRIRLFFLRGQSTKKIVFECVEPKWRSKRMLATKKFELGVQRERGKWFSSTPIFLQRQLTHWVTVTSKIRKNWNRRKKSSKFASQKISRLWS